MTKSIAFPLRHSLRSVALAAMLALAPGFAFAQATYTWVSPTSSAWSTPANWSPPRTSPASDDVLVFDGGIGANTTVQSVVTQTIGRIRLQNGAFVSLIPLSPGPVTITVSGGTGDDLSVPAGCQLIVQAGSTPQTVLLGAGATGLVSGQVLIGGSNARLGATDANALVFSAGALATCNGNSTPFGTSAPGSVHFQSGSICVVSGPCDVFGAAAPASVVTFEPGSLYRLTSNTLPTLSGRTFADFELNSSGLSPTPATGAAATYMQNVTLKAGNMVLHLGDLHIRGNVVLQGGSATFTPGSSTSISLDGSTPQTLSRTSGNWQFNNNAHLKFLNPNGITLASGFLAPGKATLDAACTLTIGTGPQASLQNNNTFDVYGTLLLSAGSVQPSGQNFNWHPGSQLICENAAHFANATPAWWPAASSPTNVTIAGSGGIEFQDAATRTISGTLTLTNGVLDAGAGTIAIGPSGTVTGGSTASHVRGTLRKSVATAAGTSTYAFEVGDGAVYAPVTVEFPSVSTGGTLSAHTRAGDHPAIATSGLNAARTANRYWTLSGGTLGHTPATARFEFVTADLDAHADPTAFASVRFTSPSTWSTASVSSALATSLTAQSLAQLDGDYQLGEALPACNATASFTRTNFATGTGPWGLSVADLNADGRMDIATANYTSNTVSVLLGSGFGAFTLSNTYAAGANPVSMAIADVNADAQPDLVVANWSGVDVSEFLATGGGAFAAATTATPTLTITRPISALLGNLNGDASPDLFVVSWSASASAALPGSPSGIFGATTAVPTQPSAYDAALGDLNGDGKLDVVIANHAFGPPGTTLSVRLGDGAGSFTSAPDVTVGSQPSAVALGDVNGDGLLDAVCANELSNTISILAGDGAGGFSSRLDVATGNAPFDVAIGDVNGDGRADIVAVNSTDGTVSVYPSNCTGGFHPRLDFAVGSAPRHVAIADLDQDGYGDMVVTNAGSNNVSVLRNALGSPYVTSTVYRSRYHARLGGALLRNESNQRIVAANIGSSGQDGVSIQATSSDTPAAIVFADGGLQIGPLDDWGWLSVTLDGQAASAVGSLGGMRLDVKPTGLELRTNFASVGATHQRVELYAGATRVHSCDVPDNTLVSRPPVLASLQGNARNAAPSIVNAAGDGIGGVEVGLKKKPGGSRIQASITFTTPRPTTVGGTTVNADRVVVSTYAPKQPLAMWTTQLRASAPAPTHPLNTIAIATEPDAVSDTTWQVAGLAVRRTGGAQMQIGPDDVVVSGIGSSGQDGVECDLTHSDGAVHTFAPGQGFQTSRDAGAQLVHTVSGVIACDDDQLVGTLTERAYSDSITVRSDFSPIGATQVTIELLSNNNVVHTGVYAASQAVALVAPPAGPGQSAQAASINTSRSNLRDFPDPKPAKKPKQSIAWKPDPNAYRLLLGGTTYVADEVRFTAIDGVAVTKLTSATIRQKNPGVPQLDTLRMARPGLMIGASDFAVRAIGGRRMLAPDSARVVTYRSSIWMEDMWEVVAAPAPSPRISVQTSGPAVATTLGSAKIVVSANGLTAASAAASAPAVSIARSGLAFAISPSAALLAENANGRMSPTSASSGNWRLQVLSGAVLMAEITGVSPEASAALFPDRVGMEAVGQTFEARWSAPISITVAGGPVVSGDRVRLTPLTPPEALAQVTELVLISTNVDYLELSDPSALATTDVAGGPVSGGLMLSVQRNPVRGGGPVGFAVQLPAAQSVRLDLFDLLGRRVATLHDGAMRAGVTQLTWNASAQRVGSSVMLARLVTPNGTHTQKFVMIR